MDTNILSKVKKYIGNTFREKGSPESHYHNFTHTAEVAKAAEEIADAIGISDSEREILHTTVAKLLFLHCTTTSNLQFHFHALG